jgi:rhodanese-related sulfurtransferase
MTKTAIKTINAQELKAKMAEQTDLCLIDVREADEWNEARIPGAQHIPKDLIGTNIKTVIADTLTPIYLHCRSGVRSLYAAETLMSLGYEDVYSLDGGILGWHNQGYPIEV